MSGTLKRNDALTQFFPSRIIKPSAAFKLCTLWSSCPNKLSHVLYIKSQNSDETRTSICLHFICRMYMYAYLCVENAGKFFFYTACQSYNQTTLIYNNKLMYTLTYQRKRTLGSRVSEIPLNTGLCHNLGDLVCFLLSVTAFMALLT